MTDLKIQTSELATVWNNHDGIH